MGKGLNELYGLPGPVTHRQYLAWQEWLLQEWDQPSRADYYAMQTAFTVARANAAEPGRVKFSAFKLPFDAAGEKGTARPKVTREQAAEWAKAKWMAAVPGAVYTPAPGGPGGLGRAARKRRGLQDPPPDAGGREG